jgi:hypothetical protein
MQERTALQQITTDAESGRPSMPLRARDIAQGSTRCGRAAAVGAYGVERLSSVGAVTGRVQARSPEARVQRQRA